MTSALRWGTTHHTKTDKEETGAGIEPEATYLENGRVIEEGWSVRKLERYIKEYAKQRDTDVPRTRSKQPRLFKTWRTQLQSV